MTHELARRSFSRLWAEAVAAAANVDAGASILVLAALETVIGATPKVSRIFKLLVAIGSALEQAQS